jgi:hypothetical protein
MGLIKENNGQYYSGQQILGRVITNPGDSYFINGGVWTFDTTPISAFAEPIITTGVNQEFTQVASISNFSIFYEPIGTGVFTAINENLIRVSNQYTGEIEILPSTTTGFYDGNLYIQLKKFAVDDNYGSYSYIKLKDVINNFIVGYVGEDKLIRKIKKQDVVFHAKRGLQEFSYDTLNSIKSIEINTPLSLSFALPQDYVNYVKLSWIDEVGAKHVVYPTRVTSNPTSLPLQDGSGDYIQDSFGSNTQSEQSLIETAWESIGDSNSLQPADYRITPRQNLLGQKYGLSPEESQINGKFTINQRLNSISLSSDLAGKLLMFEYISDGLAYDEDMLIPKLAEQAMYMHIMYSILSTRTQVPEYIVSRYKKEKSSTLRNAKIRLNNIKTEEIAQVFRNKSKWIKH